MSEWSETDESKKARQGMWFPVVLGVFLMVMVVVALVAPKQNKNGWLSLTGTLASKKKEEVPLALSEEEVFLASLPRAHDLASRVSCATTKGPLVMDMRSDWCPLGTPRFLDMVKSKFFSTRVSLFRAVPGFIVQTGVAGDPAVNAAWQNKGKIMDDAQWMDPPRFMRGYVAFAGSGRNSRTTEFFIAYQHNRLGRAPWEVPCGHLVGDTSYATMDAFYTGYGDVPAFGGNAPKQQRIYSEGNAYLDKDFPKLDYILSCDIIQGQVQEQQNTQP